MTFGQHLARIRRERGMTQVELAAQLGVPQPLISQYERGVLRLHGDLLVRLSKILDVSADELLGLEKKAAPKHAYDRRFLRRLNRIEDLSKRDKQALLRTIDAFLGRAS